MKTKNPTVLDYAILGLLRQEAMSGYRIRKVFEETEMGNYSGSPGTIYPALKRLLSMDQVDNEIDEASHKKVFRITNTGMHSLKLWLIRPIEYYEVERKREELLLRFAFMDILDDDDKVIEFLNTFRDLLSRHIVELEHFHKDELNKLPIYGRLAFEQGIASAKATLKWCKKANEEVSKLNA